jgi:hypothetical protein
MYLSPKVLKELEYRHINPNTLFDMLKITTQYANIIYRKGYNGYTYLEEVFLWGLDENNVLSVPQYIGVRGFAIFENGEQIQIPQIHIDGHFQSTSIDNALNKIILFFKDDYRT